MAPVEIRGQLVAIYIFVITFTQFFATIIGLLMSPNWRLMYDWIIFLGIAYFIAMCFMPESPRWLGKEGKDEEKLIVISKIYKPEFVENANQKLD